MSPSRDLPPPSIPSPATLNYKRAHNEQLAADAAWKDVEAARAKSIPASRSPKTKHLLERKRKLLEERLRKAREETAAVEREIAAFNKRSALRKQTPGFEIYEDDDARAEREDDEELQDIYERAKARVSEVSREDEELLELAGYDGDMQVVGEEEGEEDEWETVSDSVASLAVSSSPPHARDRRRKGGSVGRKRKASASPPGRKRDVKSRSVKRQEQEAGESSEVDEFTLERSLRTTIHRSTDEIIESNDGTKISNTSEDRPVVPDTTNTTSDAILHNAPNPTVSSTNLTYNSLTIPFDPNNPSPEVLQTVGRALTFAIKWLAPYTKPSLLPTFQALQVDYKADPTVARVLVAVLRQRASAEEWELFRRFVKNAKKHVKIEEIARRLEECRDMEEMGGRQGEEQKAREGELEEQIEQGKLRVKWEEAQKQRKEQTMDQDLRRDVLQRKMILQSHARASVNPGRDVCASDSSPQSSAPALRSPSQEPQAKRARME